MTRISFNKPTIALTTTRKFIFAFNSPNVTEIFLAASRKVTWMHRLSSLSLQTRWSRPLFLPGSLLQDLALPKCVIRSERLVRKLSADKLLKYYEIQTLFPLQSLVSCGRCSFKTAFVDFSGILRHHLGVYAQERATRQHPKVLSSHHTERLCLWLIKFRSSSLPFLFRPFNFFLWLALEVSGEMFVLT